MYIKGLAETHFTLGIHYFQHLQNTKILLLRFLKTLLPSHDEIFTGHMTFLISSLSNV